jgi:hypothetical protein
VVFKTPAMRLIVESQNVLYLLTHNSKTAINPMLNNPVFVRFLTPKKQQDCTVQKPAV